MKTFGKNLKHLRKSHNLSQIALADYIGIDATYLSQIERAIRPDISVRIAKKISNYFWVSLDSFVSDDLTKQ